jgi:hypothetical protein
MRRAIAQGDNPLQRHTALPPNSQTLAHHVRQLQAAGTITAETARLTLADLGETTELGWHGQALFARDVTHLRCFLLPFSRQSHIAAGLSYTDRLTSPCRHHQYRVLPPLGCRKRRHARVGHTPGTA